MSQRSQKKTRAIVAQSDEDGEKAFTCVEVEGTRFKRNSNKSGTEGSINSDRLGYSAACHAQSNDGQTYIGVGRLNGRPVKVLRYTGCTGIIVDMTLFSGRDGDTRQFRLTANGGPYLKRCAFGKRLFGCPILQRTLQGDVCELPRLPSDYWKRARGTTDVARPRMEG